MTLPGETEAGSPGMQPCRGIAWWAHRNDVMERGSSPFALYPKPHRIGRPQCLENPRPEGAEYSFAESAPSPLHAEPEHILHVPILWWCLRRSPQFPPLAYIAIVIAVSALVYGAFEEPANRRLRSSLRDPARQPAPASP